MSGAPDAIVARELGDQELWVVGGTVRDELIGRATADLDLATAGDPALQARALARALRVPVFALSEAFGAWRLVGDGWQIDVSVLQGATIGEDLAQRDLTVNAIARPIAGGGLIDPYGGEQDLAARRLRMVSERAFDADPLRVLRLARLATVLGFGSDPATVAAAAERAPLIRGVAGERVFAELRELIAAPAVVAGIRLLDELGLTTAMLPELAALRGVEQNRYHHLDVYEHTLLVLEGTLAVTADPGAIVAGLEAADARQIAQAMSEPAGDGVTRGDALRWSALLHDIAKPQTQAVADDGTVVGFPGHSDAGVGHTREVMGRLKVSTRLSNHLAALTRHHLGLGFLVHADPLDRRTIYRYLDETSPVELDVSLLSIADRLATGGHKAELSTERHLAVARAVLPRALRFAAERSRPPLVRGDRLASELGIEPGPRLGELLAEIAAARYSGEVGDAESAIAHARALLA